MDPGQPSIFAKDKENQTVSWADHHGIDLQMLTTNNHSANQIDLNQQVCSWEADASVLHRRSFQSSSIERGLFRTPGQ